MPLLPFSALSVTKSNLAHDCTSRALHFTVRNMPLLASACLIALLSLCEMQAAHAGPLALEGMAETGQSAAMTTARDCACMTGCSR